MTMVSFLEPADENDPKAGVVKAAKALPLAQESANQCVFPAPAKAVPERVPATSPPPHIFALFLAWLAVVGPRAIPTVLVVSAIFRRLKQRLRRRVVIGMGVSWMLNYLFHVRPVHLRLGCEEVNNTRAPDHHVPSASAMVRARMVHIVRKCPSLSQLYWPTWWAPHSLLQVLLLLCKEARARVLERNPYRRQILALKDNARIALDWIDPPRSAAAQADLPVCVLLHGAFMDSSSVTMSDLARSLAARGFPTVVMNRRGYGGVGLHGPDDPKLALFGLDEDLDEVLVAVAAREPGRQVAIIGFSCGSGFATRYTGLRGHLSAWQGGNTRVADEATDNPGNAPGGRMPRILCMVGMDGGYDASLDQGPAARVCWPYSWIINWSLKYFYVVRHWRPLKDAGKWELMKSIVCPMKGLVSTYKASIHMTGAPDVNTFMKLQSPVLHGIEVPSLLINSRDDPICVWDNVEYSLDEITSNPHIAHAEMYCGTHGCKFGFLGSSSFSESMIGEFVHASWSEWKATHQSRISSRGGG